MDFLIISIGLLISWTLIQSILSFAKPNKNLPPGPIQLPIIGNLHRIGSNPHRSLAELAKIHGPIMTLKLGQITNVVISSSSLAKETLQKQGLAFSTPYIPDSATAHRHSERSIIWVPATARWRRLRKSITTNIFSNSRLQANQHLRSRKVEELVEYCREAAAGSKAVDIGRTVFETSVNLLSNIFFSVDLTDSDKNIKQVMNDVMTETSNSNLADSFPVIKKMKIDPQGVRRRLAVALGKLLNLMDELIDQRMESRKLTSERNNDFLDLCLNSSQENPEEQIGRIHIRHFCPDLFLAGNDTTASTMEWAMTELLRKPDVVTKAKVELELVIGKGKIIEEANLSQLPYLLCIVKETLRLHAPIPILYRLVESDVEVNEFIIPKNSQVMINVWAIGRDSSNWEDTLNFNPDRFLNSDVDVRGQDFELIPFGAGRRMCPGLPLAMKMMPVMLGSLINSFDWKLDGSIEPKELDMEERFGVTMNKAQPLCVIPVPLMVE